MGRLICLTLNALAGAGVLLSAAVEPTIGPAGHREEIFFYLIASLLFLLIAAGLLLRIRWLADIPAIPLLLGGLLLALLIAAGVWLGGSSNPSTMNLLILMGAGTALLEMATMIVARRMGRRVTAQAHQPPP